MKRSKLTRRGSKRLFRKTAMLTHIKNIKADGLARGGIRN